MRGQFPSRNRLSRECRLGGNAPLAAVLSTYSWCQRPHFADTNTAASLSSNTTRNLLSLFNSSVSAYFLSATIRFAADNSGSESHPGFPFHTFASCSTRASPCTFVRPSLATRSHGSLQIKYPPHVKSL